MLLALLYFVFYLLFSDREGSMGLQYVAFTYGTSREILSNYVW